MMRCSLLLPLLLLCCLPSALCAAQKKAEVASVDRSLWPDSLNSLPSFNRASRQEILAFGSELLVSEWLPADEWPSRLGIAKVDMLGIERYRHQTWLRLLQNYRIASNGCSQCPPVHSVTALRQVVSESQNIGERYVAWQKSAQRFYARYLLEQLRLAATFSSQSNEIDTLTPSEMTGNELLDGEFLLTFDDGPSAEGGATSATVKALSQAGQNGVFFLVGERLQQRLSSKGAGKKVAAEYGDNCVASHGMRHTAYPELANWQESLQQSLAVLQRLHGATRLSWFRPPYAQRTPEMEGSVFRHLVLWNIDSRDADKALNASQVRDRVVSLMLLWRKGIIRFHDAQPKAAEALPGVFAALHSTPVRWVDCHNFAGE